MSDEEAAKRPPNALADIYGHRSKKDLSSSGIASYHTTGTYAATTNFFTSSLSSGPLTAPSSDATGGNGVYAYGGSDTTGIFPTSSFHAANYEADVVFRQLA